MKYTLLFSTEALKGLEFWKKSGQKKIISKIARIFAELEEHLYIGIGHPEPLKENLLGKGSREINKKDRIIYKVIVMVLEVEIISTKSHYGDK